MSGTMIAIGLFLLSVLYMIVATVVGTRDTRPTLRIKPVKQEEPLSDEQLLDWVNNVQPGLVEALRELDKQEVL